GRQPGSALRGARRISLGPRGLGGAGQRGDRAAAPLPDVAAQSDALVLAGRRGRPRLAPALPVERAPPAPRQPARRLPLASAAVRPGRRAAPDRALDGGDAAGPTDTAPVDVPQLGDAALPASATGRRRPPRRAVHVFRRADDPGAAPGAAGSRRG